MTNTNAKDLHKGLREAGNNLLHFENHKNQKKKEKTDVIGRRSCHRRQEADQGKAIVEPAQNFW
jgi:hypothetical protein